MVPNKVLVKCFVENNGAKLLLVKRSKTAPRRPLQWDLPGGFVDDEEDYHAAIERETQEETGLAVHETHLAYAMTRRSPEGKPVIFLFYRAKTDETDVTLSYEHDDHMWATPEEAYERNHYDIHREATQFIYQLEGADI